jgi:glucose-6-phosphate dehydrogenase assembly protein OpcA
MGTPDVKIPDIQKELDLAATCSEDKKQLKACLFTLIIYAHEKRRVDYIQELVDTILDKFPCRIIYIQEDENSDKSYCHVNVTSVMSGASLALCDQITIQTSQDQLFRVPFLVIPYIVSDLPVYLLWGQNPFEEHEIFPHLHGYGSRVIFDSECSDNLELFCKEMQANLNVLKMDVMDINWALVSNWRDLLAHLFDNPKKLMMLKKCKSIVITYNDNKTKTIKHPEIRAIYLQGWLASQLNWRYFQTEKFDVDMLISYIGEQFPAIVALHPEKISGLPPGSIASIEITTVDGHVLFLERRPEFPHVVIHESSKETCELPFTLPLPNVHRGMNFMKEIFHEKLGSHYLGMLKMISQINNKML